MPAHRPRLFFMDNLRFLSEWCVVIFHTAVGYAALSEFFIETNTSSSLLAVRNAIVIFTLPLLFLVAGYFTLPSLDKHGSRAFLTQRLKRLGIPFLVGICLLGPLMPYLGYYEQSFKGLPTDSYWYFWTRYLADGFTHWSHPAVFTTHPGFHHQHFYFLSFLIEILLIFLIGRWAWQRLQKYRKVKAQPPSSPRFTFAFLAIAFAVPLLHYLTAKLPGAAQVFGFLFYFSLSDFLLLGGAFALGVYAWNRRWFVDGALPGWATFVILAVVLVLFLQGGNLLHAFRLNPSEDLIKLDQNISHSLITWLAVATLLAVGARWMNRRSGFSAEMAASSYDIYLLQYPVILALRLPLVTWEAPAWLKFGLVVPGTILICWALSRFMIRPRPKMTLVILLGLHLLLSVFGLPRWGDSHLLLDRRPELLTQVPNPEGGQELEIHWPGLEARHHAVASVARIGNVLYLGHNQGGLLARNPDGSQEVLIDNLQVGDLAALPGGELLLVDTAANRIVRVNPGNGVQAPLLNPGHTYGTPQYLAAVGNGNLYFTTLDNENHASLFLRRPDQSVFRLDLDERIHTPRGIALSPDGRALFLADADGLNLWAATIHTDGELSDWRIFGELFRADRRYGKLGDQAIASSAEELLVDRTGRVFVATSLGVQIFTPAGRFVGLISFPQLLSKSYYPPRPLSLALGAEDEPTLYVTCGDLVFALELNQ